MRNLLLLALLLYDIIAIAMRPSYEYEDYAGNKRHSFDERRNFRKKALQKSYDSDQKEWEDRRRYENHNVKYNDDIDFQGYGGTDRHRRFDSNPTYKDNRRFDDLSKMKIPQNIRSSEIDRVSTALEKDVQKKMIMNCGREHESLEGEAAGIHWVHEATNLVFRCSNASVTNLEQNTSSVLVTCDNPRERLRPCYPFCEPGCVCTHPYVRDDRTHKCVLPEDCSKGLKGIPDLGEDV